MLAEDPLKKMKKGHHKFQMQMNAQWGMGENGEKAGYEFREMEKEKRRKKFGGGNKSEKTGSSPEDFFGGDEKLAAEIEQAKAGIISKPAPEAPENGGRSFQEKVAEKFGEKEDKINDAVYNIAERELPDKIEDLYDKSVNGSGNKKKEIKKAETNKSEDFVGDVNFQGVYHTIVNKWLKENNKKHGELQKEDVERLRKEAWKEFENKFPNLVKKYKKPEEKDESDSKKDEAKTESVIEEKGKAPEEEKYFAGKKMEEPEIIDAEFIEHKPLEITDQNWRGERQEGIKKLQKELEQARKEYLEMDYKKRGMWERVSRFFGNKLHGRKGREDVAMKTGKDTGEMVVDDQDVVYMRALYENKLFDLRNAMLEDAKAKGIKVEDLAEAEKIFEIESRVKLADEHDKVRVENSGKWAGPLRENLVKMNEWYRKQPLKYKLAVGVAFGLGGAAAGAGLISGLGATAVMSAAFARRLAMGAITGTGAAMTMESVASKRRTKKTEKKAAGFSKEVENLSEEELYNKFKEKTQELIFSADDKLQSYKNWDRIRLAAGGAVAGIIGSGAMGDIARFLSQKSGVGEMTSTAWHKAAGILKSSTPEIKPGSGVPSGYNMPAGGGNATIESGGKVGLADFGNNETIENAGTLVPDNNATVGKGGDKILEKTAPGSKAEIAKNISLEVKKGSSFEGAIIKQLEEKGANKKEAGKMAHKMYLEYIKNHPDPAGKGYNLVHPGAKIELSPDGKRIVSFHDSPPSEWEKHPGGRPRSGRMPRVLKPEVILEKTTTEPFNFDQVNQDLSGMKAMEKELMEIANREKNFQGFSYGKSKVNLIHLDEKIEQFQNRIKLSSKSSETRTFREILEDLTQRKMALELKIHDFERFKELNESFNGSVSKVFNKIAKLALFEAGAHEEFSLEKMNASEYIKNHSGGNFGKFYKDCAEIYGKKMVGPLEGETMKDWAGRVTKLIVKNRMMSGS